MGRRRTPGIVTGTLAGVLLLGACSSAPTGDRAPASTGTGSTSTAATTPPATDPVAAGPTPTDPAPTGATPIGPTTWAVATATVTFVDPARGRTLATTVYYPANAPTGPTGPVAASDPTDAAVEAAVGADPAPGPFPLVLFAHGYLLPGDGYDRMLRSVAARGYVVAAPEFPHTTAHGGDGQRSDLTNQPADLSFLADRLVELAGTGASTGPGGGADGGADLRLPALADPQRLAVVGHSDGGLTATAIGYGASFRDRRVAAVVSLTGGIGLFPGPFLTEADPPPVLAVHARDDGTNPFSASTALVAQVPPGRARLLVTVAAGGHIDPYMYATGRPELGAVIAGFLDLTVRGDPTGSERLRAAVAAAPDLELTGAEQ